MGESNSILVVGSLHMDLVIRSPRLPAPGETLMGSSFKTSPGGKGANQAVAAARLGGAVSLLGRVGKDAFGAELLAALTAQNVDCAHVLVTEDAATGVAIITVDAQGENAIVVATGANALLTPDDLYGREHLFKQAAFVLLQLELPYPTIRAAMDLARRHGCKIVLDPAPAAAPLPPDMCQVDILTPNIVEAAAMTGTRAVDDSRDKLVASDLIRCGAAAVALKLGPRGALAVMGDGHFYRAQPYKVQVVDTTAAGDAFTAALAVACARGDRMHDALTFATAAGAMACTRLGAQASMPLAQEVRMLMDDQPM